MKDLSTFIILTLLLGPIGWIIYALIQSAKKTEAAQLTNELLLRTHEERVEYMEDKEVEAEQREQGKNTAMAGLLALFLLGIFMAMLKIPM